ncbi:MAG: hypothetical protein HY704_08100 [Gemmatimonadetes bacterium]|nr:hypothetical protein [Gemmatimonadota bacterium]
MPAALAAQEECELLRSRWVQSLAVGGGHSILFFSGPVSFRCRGGIVLRADSAEHFQAQNETHMLGHVSFADSIKTFTADRANYLRSEQRIVAWGTVEVQDKRDGSVITGDTLRYLRPTASRGEEQMVVTGRRPRAILYLRGDTARTADSAQAIAVPEPTEPTAAAPDTAKRPYDVEADRLVLSGNRYFEATGRVQITRDGLKAFAESAEYDRAPERLMLAQAARIEGEDYELFGETITLYLPGGDVRDIIATEDALLLGERLRLAAPRIRIELAESELRRVYALAALKAAGEAAPAAAVERPPGANTTVSAGPERAEAVAEDFLLRADSVEVVAPAQRIEEVIAVGGAHGEALKSDTVLGPEAPILIRRDWIEGDTIRAYFTRADSGSTTAAPDSAALPLVAPERSASLPAPEAGRTVADAANDTTGTRVRIERMIARGHARSVYRIASTDTAQGARRVSVHYVTGNEITITMDDRGEVRSVSVRGPTRGVHLEPVPAQASRPAMSGGAAEVGAGPASEVPHHDRDSPRRPVRGAAGAARAGREVQP